MRLDIVGLCPNRHRNSMELRLPTGIYTLTM
jgi:hypothetical protein